MVAPTPNEASNPGQETARGFPCDVSSFAPLPELRNRIGGYYGSEDLAVLFYALIRRERPLNIVELGSGLGVTLFWMA